MTVAAAGLSFLGVAIIIINPASAQTEPPKPTSDQLEECKSLGIRPEKCSEQAILSKRCLGGPGAPCGGSGVNIPIDVNMNLIPIYLGIAGAFVAGVLYVKKASRWRRGKANVR
ncbi:hypothetical protein [Nitrososphaera sp.]|uniref:hypothetical protein n=1 Tax=Nitrososphaera sp. TaxID=1971748 RepID=UPI00307EB834